MHFYKYLVACGKDDCDEAPHLLLEQLLQELHNFEKRFCKYIKDNIVNPENKIELNTKYVVNAVNLLAKLTGFSNVNYTALFDIIGVKSPCVYS